MNQIIPQLIKPAVRKETFVFVLLMFVYCFFQYDRLLLDFWNDELYTMKHFIFVSPATTVSDYHVPNNHIFFNLISKSYLSITGNDSLKTLLENPYKLRVLPFIFSLASLYMVWEIGKRFFNPRIALLAVGCMISCVPFLNYALQIRGYGLSILLVTLIIYSCLVYVETKKNVHLFLIGLFTLLIMYTIPSNLLFLLSLGVLQVVQLVLSIRRSGMARDFFKAPWKNPYVKMNIALAIGVGVCLLLYLPIFRQVFFNEYVVADVFKDSVNGFQNTLQSTLYFISNRYFLLVLAGIGLMLFVIKRCRLPFVYQSLALLFLYLFPFIISLIRKDNPPDRIYTNTIPLLSLAMATLIHTSIESVIKSKAVQFLLLLCILSVCIFLCMKEEHKIEIRLKQDLITGERSQNLYYNYFLCHYSPLKAVRKLKNLNPDLVMINDSEPHDMPVYLRTYDIPFSEVSSLDSIIRSQPEEFYIITRYPDITKKEYASKKYNYSFNRVDSSYSYHNLIHLRRNRP